MTRRVVLACCWLAWIGCVETNTVVCEGGVVCPSNYVCDATRGCISQNQIDACVGKAELDACSYAAVEMGLCSGGLCIAVGCGNGVVDGGNSGEVCDDGNVDSNDGCSFDCRSNETCGNGVVDFIRGETCDDGDTLSHDGCGSCEPEVLAWERVDLAADNAPTPSPPPRVSFAMAYDAARGVSILFGGVPSVGLSFADTWAWNGTAWAAKPPSGLTPSKRIGHALAYDSKRHRVILFGGYDDQDRARYDDTWEWNGTAWRNISPPTGNPSPRYQHALAYDSARDRMVMFGGDDGAAATWEWDGAAWQNVTPAGANPVSRREAAMAYDPVRARVVLFGGRADNDALLGDTWEWNGTAWTNVTPAPNAATAREEHALAFDAVAGRVVLFGGYNGTALSDTLEWNGTTWTPIAAGGPAMYGHSMVFDSARRRLVIALGRDGSGFIPRTYERSGATWTDVTLTPTRPGPRQQFGMAYDSTRGRMVMFGGEAGGPLGDTWEWGAGAWRLRSAGGTSAEPSARTGVTLAYDPHNAATLLFGGRDSTERNDTWLWNGSAWSNVTPTAGNPGVRYDHGLAYDSARRRMVMFGGRVGTGTAALDDTWEWNGTSWSNVTPPSGNPAARFGHQLAFDAARGRVVLFGGWQGIFPISLFDDTWEWDGTSWTLITPQSARPRARRDHMMAYDDARGRVVLFSGDQNVLGSGFPNDLWEWDGTAWRGLPLLSRPAGRIGAGFAYDKANRELILFSGQTGFTNQETWALRYDNALPDDACSFGIDGDGDGLVGCDDQDCFGICSPTCNPTLMTCGTMGPRCGDGTCHPVENRRSCPDDCGAPMALCGDAICDDGETATSCPGDCTP